MEAGRELGAFRQQVAERGGGAALGRRERVPIRQAERLVEVPPGNSVAVAIGLCLVVANAAGIRQR